MQPVAANAPPGRVPAWDVLVVDGDPAAAARLAGYLRAEGHRPAVGARAAGDGPVDLVFLTLDPAAGVGGEAVRRWAREPAADVVIVTAAADLDRAVRAVADGAADHLLAPVTPAALELVLRRVADRRRLAAHVRSLRGEVADDPDADLPTDTPAVHRLLDLARRVAATAAPVLIVGEPGTGKGRLARALHGWSGRADGPLAVVTMAADADALDAELFGAAAAGVDLHGQVARCRGGTLILDRVGELPWALQPKVRRLIADRQYERQDEVRPRPADVRVVATAADDLSAAERAGRFRGDLRLALDVVRLDVPPLRDRPRDVPLLAERYLAHAARRTGRPATSFAPAALAVLAGHGWPGNQRELRNVVERAAHLAAGDRVEAADLPADVRTGRAPGAASHVPGDLVPLREIEDLHIRRVVAAVGNARAAAAVLGIDPSTVWRRIRPPPRPADGAHAP